MAEKGNAGTEAGEAAASTAEQMKAAGDAMSDTSARLGLKMLDQAETNTMEAFRAMRAAAGASDLSEVMRIQSDWVRDQGSRSVQQAREIGELIAKFGRDTIGQMTRKG